MSWFRRDDAAEVRGRGWAEAVRGDMSTGGVSLYEGGAPVPLAAAAVNGASPVNGSIWSSYGAVGEFHANVNFLANCLNRCTLRLGLLDEDNKPGPAFDEKGKPLGNLPPRLAKLGSKMIAGIRSAPGMRSLEGPIGGQGLILSSLGKQLAGPAECYLTVTKTPMGDHWEVLSTMELVPIPKTRPEEKQRFTRRRGTVAGTIAGTEEVTPDFYLRVFRPHPALSSVADSSAVPLLSILERIALLNAEGLADSKSRLKGPGVYWLPSEIDFPATDEDPDGDEYMTRRFIDTASIAIREPDSASRQVPIVARGPAEALKAIRHDRFDYNDQGLIDKRGAAVGDLARGTDLPYEATIGYGGTSFANAFAIDEQLARIYVSPWLDLACGFLTGGWFTAGLMQAMDLPLTGPPSADIARMVVWYDLSGLVVSPDPTKVAMWAYGNDTNPNSVISAKGARRLLGIPDGEAPDDAEKAEREERAQKFRARSEKGGPANDGEPVDPEPDKQGGEQDKAAEVGKRVMGIGQAMIDMAVDRAGVKLRSRVQGGKDATLKARIEGVNSCDVARVLGPVVVESMGGTGPLFDSAFDAFERTVTTMFVDIDRDDAADLAAAAKRMVERCALARLSNPAARLDARGVSEFMDLLIPDEA